VSAVALRIFASLGWPGLSSIMPRSPVFLILAAWFLMAERVSFTPYVSMLRVTLSVAIKLILKNIWILPY
jgi:hypothetical protein